MNFIKHLLTTKIKETYEKKIIKTVSYLKKSKRIFFITGAGISADSGLQTFRGIGGFYINKKMDGVKIEKVFSEEIVKENPELLWKIIFQMEKSGRHATYNRAHEIIVLMEKYFEVLVVTMNVDNFHESAGSSNVIKLHGDLYTLKCLSCKHEKIVKDYSCLENPPLCKCGGIFRPDVVLFGETLSEKQIQNVVDWLEQGFDMIFVIGSTGLFPYVMEPVKLAKNLAVPTIEINPGKTKLSGIVDIKLKEGAAKAMEDVWKRYQEN